MVSVSTSKRGAVKALKSAIDSINAPITKAPADKGAPTTPPAPVQTLSNASAQTQADAICAALKAPHIRVASAALAECEGKGDSAAALVGVGVVASIHLILRIVPILRNSAPAALFTDGNNRGARVGELFASKLGLSALYRDTTRADLKSARAALIESAR